MVRSLTSAVLMVWAAAVVLGQPGYAGEPKPLIGVFMDFDVARPTSLALEAMEHEVEAIMKPTGLGVGWRWLKDNRGREAFPGLVVVRFKGRCEVGSWGEAPEPGKTVTLGSTLVEGGRALPFSEVECEQVRKTLPYTNAGTCEQEKQSALGRAMGRVLAHELYHALAHTTGHAVEGLAKASQSFRDLVTGPLDFGRAESTAIRQGVAGTGAVFSFK